MKKPADEAHEVITMVVAKGSPKDGSNETWRDEDIMFHLSKAQSHLATHIRNMYDKRSVDDENHLSLAITRLSFAMCVRDK